MKHTYEFLNANPYIGGPLLAELFFGFRLGDPSRWLMLQYLMANRKGSKYYKRASRAVERLSPRKRAAIRKEIINFHKEA